MELQICMGLGSLFVQLKDLAKALVFLRNALAILQTVSMEDVQAKYKSQLLYHLSVVLRKTGAIVDAKDACDVSYYSLHSFLTLEVIEFRVILLRMFFVQNFKMLNCVLGGHR